MDVTTDVTGKTIETDRLFLRAWKESDIHDFYAYASVEGVGEMQDGRTMNLLKIRDWCCNLSCLERMNLPLCIKKTTR